MPKPLIQTTGRRKRAVARVRPAPGAGKITVNKRAVEDYFPSETHRMILTEPLRVTETDEAYDIDATIDGGGPTGQAGALRLGIARALIELDPELRPDAQEGRVPHPRRPQEGIQEVRPQEGPQGSAVLEALTAPHRRVRSAMTPPVRHRRCAGCGRTELDRRAGPCPRRGRGRRCSAAARASSSAATPGGRGRCSRRRWPPGSPPRGVDVELTRRGSRPPRWPGCRADRRDARRGDLGVAQPVRRQRDQALRRRRPQARPTRSRTALEAALDRHARGRGAPRSDAPAIAGGPSGGTRPSSGAVDAVTSSVDGRLDGLRVVARLRQRRRLRGSRRRLFGASGARSPWSTPSPTVATSTTACGSTHPGALQRRGGRGAAPTSVWPSTVTPTGSWPSTPPGELVDGDQIIAICAIDRTGRGLLADDTSWSPS